MTDFEKMWSELGVDIERHNELIEDMNASHRRTHLSQTNRPKAMECFDRSFHASHSGRVAEIIEHRERGGKAIGTFCIYIPDEIALAVGILPIPLCGGSGWSVSYADSMLPRDICPLIRSTFGMAFSKTCPYGKLMDFEIGETTCDAKKKTWDLFGFEVMEVPQKKNKIDRELWLGEVYEFKTLVENLSGAKLTEENLHEKIVLVNRKRKAMQQISEFLKLPSPPISGLDALLISQVALNQGIDSFIEDTHVLCEELHDRVNKGICAYEGEGNRVLFAGSPSPMGNAKVHHIAESSGLRIVADESCTGLRYFRDLIDESPTNLDTMIEAIADRYFEIDCACFSPNKQRIDNIVKLCEEYNVDGVIHNILQYCHCYNIEAKIIDKTLRKIAIPTIKIETDYSQEDIGQIRTRLEAFAELL